MNAALEPTKPAVLAEPGWGYGKKRRPGLSRGPHEPREPRRRMVNALRKVARLLTGCEGLCKCEAQPARAPLA